MVHAPAKYLFAHRMVILKNDRGNARFVVLGHGTKWRTGRLAIRNADVIYP